MPVGLIVIVLPTIETRASAIGIDSKVPTPVCVIIILPVPACTFSLQVITRFALAETPVALSSGESVTVQFGAVMSAVLKFQVVLSKFGISYCPTPICFFIASKFTYRAVSEGKLLAGFTVKTVVPAPVISGELKG